jgi:uncharacterized protein
VTAGHRTRARRRRALSATAIAGAGLLAASLSARPGSGRFYLLTTGLAGTWAVGALGSGAVPLTAGHEPGSARLRAVVLPMLTGAGAFGAFYAAARVARHVPALHQAIGGVLHYLEGGSTPLVLLIASANAVAEELYFRGALWSSAATSHPLTTTTLAYAATTAVTRNPALVLAGVATSMLFGLQRRASGSVVAPAITHVTWSLLMLCYLPPLFRIPGQTANGIRGRSWPMRLAQGAAGTSARGRTRQEPAH